MPGPLLPPPQRDRLETSRAHRSPARLDHAWTGASEHGGAWARGLWRSGDCVGRGFIYCCFPCAVNFLLGKHGLMLVPQIQGERSPKDLRSPGPLGERESIFFFRSGRVRRGGRFWIGFGKEQQ